MISAILINTMIIALVVSVHYEALHTLFVWAPKLPIPNRFRVVVAIFGVLIAHTIEIWIFAASYYWLLQAGWHGSLARNFDGSLLDCAYFSFTTYTSLGNGDIEPGGHLRFLAGLESLVGLVMIGWTASFIYVEMTRFWREPDP